MLTLSTIIVLLVIVGIIGFWQSSNRARELALAATKRACIQQNLQLLDDSMSFVKLRIRRNALGRLGILRFYQFDYYDGILRLQGYITIFNHSVMDLTVHRRASTDASQQPPATPQPSTKSIDKPTQNNIIPFPNNRKKPNAD